MGEQRKRRFTRRKTCRFCGDPNIVLGYKNYTLLRQFLTERGKIVPRRITGNCARHQRQLALAVKQARNIALLPFGPPQI